MVKAIKAQVEVNNAGGAEAAPAELQEAATKLAQESGEIVKKIEANETTSKTLREEFRANATQFTTKHGLK
jgi:NTP pyrophosphatase (non-canonical NTP hydrolase)